MTDTMNPQPPAWQPPETPGKKKHHYIRNTLLIIGAVILILTVISLFSGNPSGQNASNSGPEVTPAVPAAAPSTNSPPPPVANPDGTYQGSCDYTLGTGFDNNYHVIGEIDLTNTGNVGVIVHTRITWPQEGSPPITARKTIRLPVGATNKPVRFRIPVTSDQIDLLQSWQEGHDFKDGCTYHAAFADTYGPVQG